MSAIYNKVLELVGNTPILKVNHLVPEDAAEVYVKLEAFNPASSVKDRIALSMIEAAENEGKIKPGDTIVEPTSGNTGIGLSFAGAAKGYQVVIVMPETFSVERRRLMQAYGAKLVLTPGAGGMKGAIAKAKELAEENGWFLPLQFDNPANPNIHEETTGPEIIEAFGTTGLDAFVAGVGTGGTITGAGHVLKKANPNIKIVAVESAESPVLSGGNPGPHKIQGISAGFIPVVLDTDSYDEIIQVTGDDAIATGRDFGTKEGYLIGISSGAAVKAAIEVAKKLGKGKKVLAIAADNGERYLSTALYEFED
ncbi:MULTISPECIES: cysteine synthase A [unclassified Enterococcus]|uniref:cysteine synthase A n=1 Tax=unclassified Enterococcus TaxID=2608891 RepID=UPI001558059C|nr:MULTISPECIES: cysteine synthase A [unclassified Enterococcus]MBS7577635.1 cysteine synthase A [Enterococcus sp. MMGLQ5-2]MBS7584171.1 cysteine synthase A [Enterococcus sp. MMGLQ5-1]NPD12029.1 cysteine synthase A [Enterococcus sp. MMGLQ5-1]NPD37468.1 cysteine synthase A [Enterococcus sp. MMGLQ5-2]